MQNKKNNKKQSILQQIPWIKKIILFCIIVGVGYLIYTRFSDTCSDKSDRSCKNNNVPCEHIIPDSHLIQDKFDEMYENYCKGVNDE